MSGFEYRRKREALGLTQAALADHLSVDRRTIIRVERMLEVPRLHEIAITVLANNPTISEGVPA